MKILLALTKGNQEYSKSLTFYTAKRTGSSGPSDKPQYAIMTHLLCGSQYTAVRLP